MTCQTCPAQLTAKDDKCRRCAKCRKAHPGRPLTTPTKPDTWRTPERRPRQATPPATRTSWWTEAAQAGFTAAALRHHG
jgi:hypothetical protein